VLAERCFYALHHDRIAFHDTTGRCAVASAGAAAVGLGVCVLAAPEVVVGAVIVAGVVVVGFAIKEALDTYAEASKPSQQPVGINFLSACGPRRIRQRWKLGRPS
jgi:hypothetical protein